MNMERQVVPEILDHLKVDDPRAIRSRRDLRMINFFLENENWIVRQLETKNPDGSVSELGAGRGELVNLLAESGQDSRGYDLQPRPHDLDERAAWSEGDLFEKLKDDPSSAVVGNLVLHHFNADELLKLGQLLAAKNVLIFTEPLRSRVTLGLGYLLFPWCNDVTRHDMVLSIRAGFLIGELPASLGLTEGWDWEEKVSSRGGLRSVGVRRSQ